jgi:hypothetical protein
MWQEQGFVQGDINIDEAMLRLAKYIDEIGERYSSFSNDELMQRAAPGKWSRKELLGHLIDSAINNIKRFTEIQFSEQPYFIQSYKQDELVIVNHYQQLPLEHLLQLWQSLNHQVIYVVKEIPADKLAYKVDPQYDNHEMKTLGWIICDYVAHLEHHIKQL